MVQEYRLWEKDGKEMVGVPAGEFLYGEDRQKVKLPEFWIDRTPVTNAEFAQFVQATGYKTTAEQTGIGCACIDGKWEDVEGADWQHPGGPGTDIQGKADHPVVQVTWGTLWRMQSGLANGCQRNRNGKKRLVAQMGANIHGETESQHPSYAISTATKAGQQAWENIRRKATAPMAVWICQEMFGNGLPATT